MKNKNGVKFAMSKKKIVIATIIILVIALVVVTILVMAGAAIRGATYKTRKAAADAPIHVVSRPDTPGPRLTVC